MFGFAMRLMLHHILWRLCLWFSNRRLSQYILPQVLVNDRVTSKLDYILFLVLVRDQLRHPLDHHYLFLLLVLRLLRLSLPRPALNCRYQSLLTHFWCHLSSLFQLRPSFTNLPHPSLLRFSFPLLALSQPLLSRLWVHLNLVKFGLQFYILLHLTNRLHFWLPHPQYSKRIPRVEFGTRTSRVLVLINIRCCLLKTKLSKLNLTF
jgi:hypothetical protein